MNQAIAGIIKSQIEGLDFVDKIAGLTSVVLINEMEGDTKVEKRFPVACCVSDEDCKCGMYNDLCPDSKYKSVLYFEDGGVSFLKSEGNFKWYQSTLRLVCWLNVKLINAECCDGNTCTLSSKVITQIVRALSRTPQDYTPLTRLYSEVTDQVVRSNAIFSPYTYSEKQCQYLLSPYDYFSLMIKTNFAICIVGEDYPIICI